MSRRYGLQTLRHSYIPVGSEMTDNKLKHVHTYSVRSKMRLKINYFLSFVMQAIFPNETRNFKSGGKEMGERKIVWHKVQQVIQSLFKSIHNWAHAQHTKSLLLTNSFDRYSFKWLSRICETSRVVEKVDELPGAQLVIGMTFCV